MQLRLIPALILFLGSYFPLALILLVQDISEASWSRPICRLSEGLGTCDLPGLSNPDKSLTFLVVSTVSIIVFFWVLGRLRGYSSLAVRELKPIPNDLINYVFPYVVSFMGVDLGSEGKVAGFLLFIALMFVITYRSGQILMNPLLLVAGWHLYELDVDIGENRRCVNALCKDEIKAGDKLESCLVQGIYVLKTGARQ